MIEIERTHALSWLRDWRVNIDTNRLADAAEKIHKGTFERHPEITIKFYR